MARENTINKKTKQDTHSTNTTIRTNTRLAKMRQQILPETPKRMSSKKRGMQNMQKDRSFRQTLQIQYATTTKIQHATKMSTKPLGTTTTEITNWLQEKHHKG